MVIALKLKLGLQSLDLCPECFTPPFELTYIALSHSLVPPKKAAGTQGIQGAFEFLLQMVLKAQRHTYISLWKQITKMKVKKIKVAVHSVA